MSANGLGIIAVTGRAHWQRQVFLYVPYVFWNFILSETNSFLTVIDPTFSGPQLLGEPGFPGSYFWQMKIQLSWYYIHTQLSLCPTITFTTYVHHRWILCICYSKKLTLPITANGPAWLFRAHDTDAAADRWGGRGRRRGGGRDAKLKQGASSPDTWYHRWCLGRHSC